MDCCSGEELLTQLLEDQLDQPLAAAITAHVEGCASCQERLRQLTIESTHYMRWGYFGNDRSTPWVTSVHAMDLFPRNSRDQPASLAKEARLRERKRTADFRQSMATSSWPSLDTGEWASSTRHASTA